MTLVVLNEVQSVAGLADHEMASAIGAAESTRGAPWLQREGDRVVRVRPGEQFPPWPTASEREIRDGVYYENLDAYAKANGYTGADDFKAQDAARRRQAEAA